MRIAPPEFEALSALFWPHPKAHASSASSTASPSDAAVNAGTNTKVAAAHVAVLHIVATGALAQTSGCKTEALQSVFACTRQTLDYIQLYCNCCGSQVVPET